MNKILYAGLRSLVLAIFTCLVMTGVFILTVPGTTFGVAFHACALFIFLHKIASTRTTLEDLWEAEEVLKKELEDNKDKDK